MDKEEGQCHLEEDLDRGEILIKELHNNTNNNIPRESNINTEGVGQGE